MSSSRATTRDASPLCQRASPVYFNGPEWVCATLRHSPPATEYPRSLSIWLSSFLLLCSLSLAASSRLLIYFALFYFIPFHFYHPFLYLHFPFFHLSISFLPFHPSSPNHLPSLPHIHPFILLIIIHPLSTYNIQVYVSLYVRATVFPLGRHPILLLLLLTTLFFLF